MSKKRTQKRPKPRATQHEITARYLAAASAQNERRKEIVPSVAKTFVKDKPIGSRVRRSIMGIGVAIAGIVAAAGTTAIVLFSRSHSHAVALAASSAVTSPTYLDSPGYIDASTKGITDSPYIYLTYPSIEHTTLANLPPSGTYFFAKEPLNINTVSNPEPNQPQLSTGTVHGWITTYDLTSQSYLNGYNLIAWQDLPDYVHEFNGNLSFVENKMANNKILATDAYGSTLYLVDAAWVVTFCGASFETESSKVSGNRIINTSTVQDTPWPDIKIDSITMG